MRFGKVGPGNDAFDHPPMGRKTMEMIQLPIRNRALDGHTHWCHLANAIQ